jgi:hypothetical protein
MPCADFLYTGIIIHSWVFAGKSGYLNPLVQKIKQEKIAGKPPWIGL